MSSNDEVDVEGRIKINQAIDENWAAIAFVFHPLECIDDFTVFARLL